MKTLSSVFFLTLLIGSQAMARNKVWLVKCAASAGEDKTTSNLLKSKGVGIFSTTTDEGDFRDDLCGKSGVLLGFYLRAETVNRAKDNDPQLKNAPEGFPPQNRKVH